LVKMKLYALAWGERKCIWTGFTTYEACWFLNLGQIRRVKGLESFFWTYRNINKNNKKNDSKKRNKD